MEQNNSKTILQYAMEYGTYLGILIIVKFIITTFAATSQFAATFGTVLVVAVPLFAYYLTKWFRQKSGNGSFGKLFLFGIYMYFFAALLSGIFDYVYYQYINPEYLYSQQEAVEALVTELSKSGDSQMLTDFKDEYEKMGPMSAIQMAFQGIWGMLILGTVYALILALLMQIGMRKDKEQI